MAEKDLRENPFRDEIFNYFLGHGYVEGQKADYDYKHALDTAKLFQFLEDSQADGIAIGRGILADASLIHRIEHYLKTGEKLPEPTLQEKINMLKWLLDEEIKLRGEDVAIKFCRKFYAYYLTGFSNAAKVRGQLVTEDSYKNIIKTLDDLTTYAQAL